MLEITKTLEKKYEEAQERVTRIGQLLDICRDMENRMKWDCMYTDDEADENGERIFYSYADKFDNIEPDSYEDRQVKKGKAVPRYFQRD